MKLSNVSGTASRFRLLTTKSLKYLIMFPTRISAEAKYLAERVKSMGGNFPTRNRIAEKLKVPDISEFKSQTDSSGKREFSSTMAFVRILATLLKDKTLGQRIVPIVADESRTFGMEPLFRQLGIYSLHGQKYRPEDADQLMYYREDRKGQILQEGITEAGLRSLRGSLLVRLIRIMRSRCFPFSSSIQCLASSASVT